MVFVDKLVDGTACPFWSKRTTTMHTVDVGSFPESIL